MVIFDVNPQLILELVVFKRLNARLVTAHFFLLKNSIIKQIILYLYS